MLRPDPAVRAHGLPSQGLPSLPQPCRGQGPPALHAHPGASVTTHTCHGHHIRFLRGHQGRHGAAARFQSTFPRSSPGAGDDPTARAVSTAARFPGETEGTAQPPAGAQSSGRSRGRPPGLARSPGATERAVPLRLDGS